jgi:prephenate dehydrogenase
MDPRSMPDSTRASQVAPIFDQLGLIGCGLIGGCFALALKQAGLVRHVVGYDANPVSLQEALALGVIDRIAPTAAHTVGAWHDDTTGQDVIGADLVFLAVPVSATQEVLRSIAPYLQPRALLMDAGSTKSDVIAAARPALGERIGNFVPAHPIAGKEKAGVAHAQASLFQGRQVILTPIQETQTGQLAQASRLWQALGCEVRHMSAEAHDAAFAAVSHLPHLLAFALVDSVAGQTLGAEWLEMAGTGFRDSTRIAASDPKVWRDILLANREQVLAQSRQLQRTLQEFDALIDHRQAAALEARIAQASAERAKMNKR